MINEFRIFGPPGTGKTSRLATRDIPRAIEKYGPEKVMVTSFTKAAAREISHKKSRYTGGKISVAQENVGTMHSILYHAFGQPSIMEVHYMEDWNEKFPRYKMTGSKVQNVDESCGISGTTQGDRLLNSANIKRSRMMSMTTWSRQLKTFYNKWCEFKQEVDCMDFTDLIEKGFQEFDKAPNDPKVIFVDEAQDFTRLQLSLIRKWGEHTDWIILVGDDDQTIFEFTGADPKAFLEPAIDDRYKTVLDKSWRVPRSVLTQSLRLIRKVSQREKKEYSPRLDKDGEEVIGEVRNVPHNYNDGKRLITLIQPYLEKDMTVMFLGSCSYMLEPLKKELREKAIPFHNPYRRRRGDWNPLHHQQTLMNFLESGVDEKYWNIPQFVSWAKWLQVGDGTSGLVRNVGKKGIKRLKLAIEEHESGLHTCREVIGELLAPAAVTHALDRDIDWFIKNIPQAKQRVLEYPVSVFKKHGEKGLNENPKIILGTIHCSPGNEPISTITGDINLEKLDPNVHRLLGYNSKINRLSGGTKNGPNRVGYSFKIDSRNYDGTLITIETNKSKTCITPEHRVQVRFSDKFIDKHLVYLMKRGNWWRIGTCISAHKPYRSAGIGSRLATEQADYGWILKICKTAKEAITEETKLQTKYGITGLTFETSKQRKFTQKELYKIHDQLSDMSSIRALYLLYDLGLSVEWPLYTRSSRNLRGMFLTIAANLISDYMEIPTVTNNFINQIPSKYKPKWLPIKITKKHFKGKVYSLDVPPHKHYISGGAIVHNSVKGAEADVVVVFPDISYLADQEMGRKHGRDAVYRLFYVAMTRAKSTLILCNPVVMMNLITPRMYVKL